MTEQEAKKQFKELVKECVELLKKHKLGYCHDFLCRKYSGFGTFTMMQLLLDINCGRVKLEEIIC